MAVPSTHDATAGPSITAEIGYRDARAAVRWLVDVLGFRVSLVVDGPDDTILHAELCWRNGVIFVSTLEPQGRGAGPVTMCLAAASAADVDLVHDRVVQVHAPIVFALADTAFDSHQFAAEDPEGNLWVVGTYQAVVRPEGTA